jgi:hypothetical protein
LILSSSPPLSPAPPERAAQVESPLLDSTSRQEKGGVAYDRLGRFNYPYRELLIDQPDGSRARLDGYDPAGPGEIVSRKFTQLADMQEQTALSYPARGISRSYTRDGRVKTLLSVRNQGLTVLGMNEPADVRLHYEPLPAFKEWESLIRRDRSRPALRVIPGGA